MTVPVQLNGVMAHTTPQNATPPTSWGRSAFSEKISRVQIEDPAYDA